jgi:hypothetical protein
MKTPEDEAFDELAKRQGDWGGGYQAKRAMAADKLRDCMHGSLARSCQICDLEAEVEELKSALAQPAQEPVAWAIYDKRGGSKSLHWPENHSPDGDATKFDAVPLYTTPPQPAQEPVAIRLSNGMIDVLGGALVPIGTLLYLTPPQRPWVGLTDEEIDALYLQHHNKYGECESPSWGYERAIKQTLKEKNNGT